MKLTRMEFATIIYKDGVYRKFATIV